MTNRMRMVIGLAAASLTTVGLFVTTVSAQLQGQPVQAGGRGAAAKPAPAPTSPVTGNAANGMRSWCGRRRRRGHAVHSQRLFSVFSFGVLGEVRADQLCVPLPVEQGYGTARGAGERHPRHKPEV